MPDSIELVEFTSPYAAPELSRQAAKLILGIGDYKRTKDIGIILEGMADRTTVVALDGHEQVVGTAGLRVVSQSLGVLEEVISDPNRRGMGIGRKVVEAVEGVALRQGIRELNFASTLGGVLFYKHLGYSQLGEQMFRKFLRPVTAK